MFVMIYNNNGNNTVDVIKSAANQSRLAINRLIFKEGRGSEWCYDAAYQMNPSCQTLRRLFKGGGL
jgi:hypothetical protein